jgi:hypothetical protein
VFRLDVVGKSHAPAVGLVLAQGGELFPALDHELVFVVVGRGSAVGGGKSRVAGHRSVFRERKKLKTSGAVLSLKERQKTPNC